MKHFATFETTQGFSCSIDPDTVTGVTGSEWYTTIVRSATKTEPGVATAVKGSHDDVMAALKAADLLNWADAAGEKAKG